MPSYNLETSPIIIDTDPGVDDALALALAFLSPELDVRAITLTHGNADMQCVKRNAVTILDAIAAHRKAINLPKAIPILAIGCDAPIDGQTPVTATYFHGKDGLAGIHDGQVYQTPLNWEEQLLHTTEKRKDVLPINTPTFYTTHRDAADEILFQLKNSDPLTLTLCAIGPLTNFAVAYRRDPVTFSRARRIISMGGAIDAPGNESPHAEFNYRSDPKAADVVMESSKGFEHSPSGYASRLKLIDQGKVAPIHIVVVPLDAGDVGFITHEQYEKYILALGTSTPMAAFCNGFVGVTFKKCKDLFNLDDFVIYDAYTILAAIDLASDKGDREGAASYDAHWEYKYIDLRVETQGVYTTGMCCYDRRSASASRWLGARNNVQAMMGGNGHRFARIFLNRIFNAGL